MQDYDKQYVVRVEVLMRTPFEMNSQMDMSQPWIQCNREMRAFIIDAQARSFDDAMEEARQVREQIKESLSYKKFVSIGSNYLLACDTIQSVSVSAKRIR